DMSSVFGEYNIVKASDGFVTGHYNDTTDTPDPTSPFSTDRLFQIGNGTSDFNRTNAMTVLRNGRVGIGTTTPGFLLSFPDALGDKVSFWGTSANHYGIGIQSNQLQVHTDISASDIVFGYGSSSSLTEIMRIKGTGKVGINTSTPQAELEVNGYTKMGSSAPKIQMKKLT